MRNRGVNAKKGIVRLMGDTLRAFVYKMIATISRGRAQKVATQNVLSREGISINKKLNMRGGRQNISLAQATKYSSRDARTRLVSVSLVAREKAVKRE